MPSLRSCLLLVAASCLAGCATTNKPAAASATAAPKPAQVQEEYVSETPTGSWITKKSRKSTVKPTEAETAEAQRAMAELQRKGNKLNPSGN